MTYHEKLSQHQSNQRFEIRDSKTNEFVLCFKNLTFASSSCDIALKMAKVINPNASLVLV